MWGLQKGVVLGQTLEPPTCIDVIMSRLRSNGISPAFSEEGTAVGEGGLGS